MLRAQRHTPRPTSRSRCCTACCCCLGSFAATCPATRATFGLGRAAATGAPFAATTLFADLGCLTRAPVINRKLRPHRGGHHGPCNWPALVLLLLLLLPLLWSCRRLPLLGRRRLVVLLLLLLLPGACRRVAAAAATTSSSCSSSSRRRPGSPPALCTSARHLQQLLQGWVTQQAACVVGSLEQTCKTQHSSSTQLTQLTRRHTSPHLVASKPLTVAHTHQRPGQRLHAEWAAVHTWSTGPAALASPATHRDTLLMSSTHLEAAVSCAA